MEQRRVGIRTSLQKKTTQSEQLQLVGNEFFTPTKEDEEDFQESARSRATLVFRLGEIPVPGAIRFRPLYRDWRKRMEWWIPKEFLCSDRSVKLVFRPSIEAQVGDIEIPGQTVDRRVKTLNDARLQGKDWKPSEPRPVWNIIAWIWDNNKSGAARVISMTSQAFKPYRNIIDPVGAGTAAVGEDNPAGVVYRTLSDQGRDFKISAFKDPGKTWQSYDTTIFEPGKSWTLVEEHRDQIRAIWQALEREWKREMSLSECKAAIYSALPVYGSSRDGDDDEVDADVSVEFTDDDGSVFSYE